MEPVGPVGRAPPLSELIGETELERCLAPLLPLEDISGQRV